MCAAVARLPVLETANDRFKREADVWVWQSLFLAVVLHYVALAAWPEFTIAADRDPVGPPLQLVAPLDEIPLPPAPPDVVRPAAPVISDMVDAIDATIPVNTIGSFDPALLAPPPAAAADPSGFEVWVPSMVKPELLNRTEIRRVLEQQYPPALRAMGIGGRVMTQLWLDQEGNVVQAKVAVPSEHPALDEAALKVAQRMRFSPALNRDQPVRVIVEIPIVFTIH